MLLLWLIGSVSAQSLYNLPAPFAEPVLQSGTLAVTRAGRLLTADIYGSQAAIIGLDRSIEATFDMGGAAGGVAISEDNLRGLALGREAGTLTIINLESGMIEETIAVGNNPAGVVATAERAYVTLQDEAAVVVVDLDAARVIERITTSPDPTALALWGDLLYITHLWTGELSLIYLPTGEVARTIRPHPQGTLALSLTIDPINGIAYLPQSIANTDSAATVDNRLIPVLHAVDLRTMTVTETINLAVADRNVSVPAAVVQPSNRDRLYIAHLGSNAVTVLNLPEERADAHITTGSVPRGLAFNGGFTQLFVLETVDQTVSIFDTRFYGLDDQIPVTDAIADPRLQIGLRLFHDATDSRMSVGGLMSCAACHLDGSSDGRDWFGARTPALPQPDVRAETLNAHIRATQGGSGLDSEGLDMEALLWFLRGER